MTSLSCSYPRKLIESVDQALKSVETEMTRNQTLQAIAAAEARSLSEANEPKPPEREGKRRGASKRNVKSGEDAVKRRKSANPGIVSVAINDPEDPEENADDDSSAKNEKIIKRYMGSKSNSGESRDKKEAA